MALDELLIEELGFGPVWVRRRSGESPARADTAQTPAPALRDVPVNAQAAAAAHEQAARNESADATGSDQSRATVARVSTPVTGQASAAPLPDARDVESSLATRPESIANEPRTLEAAPPAPVPQRFDATPQDFDAPPFEAYDDLPWTDDAPSIEPPVAPEAADDIHTLDWDTLAERVSNCERCRLCERRTNAVFGVGDREADWMLIGEAPGENEDKQGEPFVGQAGKLLDNMLRSLALSRESNVYIANVIKCRPPGNRNPEPDEVARCEPYLQRQVELVKPKVIVALGRFAAQSLLKSDGSIASLRGRVHEYRGVPVVVTYHPAYLLRSLPDKAKAWADLCLARKTHQEALAALGVEPGAEKGARG
ncbi:uracil-DNA glycosylase [Caballeronia grimmiae]|uniref:uracil-DNA glycosylase n=1 Tax=Caballeronia grimmiae TaxID=1071679 RepID=UPI0038BA1AB9